MNRDLLFDILSRPAAPFRERHVRDGIMGHLREGRVPHFVDPIGNVVVGVSSKAEYLALLGARSAEPVRIFIAHMDHPGFHGVKWLTKKKLEVKWFGGSPRKFLNGAKVWLADGVGALPDGLFGQAKLLKSGAAIESGVVTVKVPLEKEATEIFGGFGFRAPVWEKNRILYTKAADDLVGATVITALGMEMRKKKNAPFLGVLTRAEEVGFIGAIAHFELGWLARPKRPTLCVSLETSRQLPGAEIGKGPVVRLGDRFTTFSPGATRVFTKLAQEVLPGEHQRRIMDGGTCEGTVAQAYGHTTIAISIPLGNYHNQSFEGGPDSRGSLGPAPEFVHLDDIDGMEKLCRALMRPGLEWNEPWREKVAQFRKMRDDSSELLKLI